MLPVGDKNERHSSLDHLNEELCKNSLSPSPSLPLYRKGASMVIAVLVIPAVVEDGNTVMNFAFFYTSGAALALDHPTRSALVTIRT